MSKNPANQSDEERIVPAGKAQAEIVINKSRFIASLAPAFSVEKAREFIKEVSLNYPGASHYVPAFLIGHGRSVISHASDAGEPSGTAGQPVLRVLQGSELGNVAVVVTRYFGGIKLGTGGLVKAYTEAAKAVVEKAPRAKLVHTVDLEMRLHYSFFERVQKLIAAYGGQEFLKEFTDEVKLGFRLEKKVLEEFKSELRDLTQGSASAEIISEDPETSFPL